MTRRYPFVTLDVFTTTRFGGNPLAVFPDARGLSDAEMLALAREFNLSETTFVLPPEDPANTARVRIFSRAGEMPFAGHPNVGTGVALAARAVDGLLRFEEIAGLVEVRVAGDSAEITAPQPLALGQEMDAALLAGCVGIAPADVITEGHAPVIAACGNFFIIAQVTEAALAQARPDPAAFAAAAQAFPHLGARGLPLYLYAVTGAETLRARMFAPLTGTMEDAATGSAAAPLAALRLSLTDDASARFDITQGVEMGRPSLMRTTARRDGSAIHATVGGACVPVLRGEALL
ncbi:PhzF family phenazine biosynthesis protein [Roseococcus suduntuyensis]|uniref:Trans-2,3-dihydro-3-hydroxyanthranilate isomerase n=1 Tax=Roseococcus suduntuyensis TaxID=455361 RepID=A0A840A5S6_9PROT|nr:PhzF family phenazine biosynthesis protein [Roseococcus suduntuyensis]MBB3896869.1 trans-2,3-dihydro-3-hydroxyanthranilate isomerase [Roseococcus suduntuyensis]